MKNLTLKELKEKYDCSEDEEVAIEVCGKVNTENGSLSFGETIILPSLIGHAEYWKMDENSTVENVSIDYMFDNDFIEIEEDYYKDDIEIEDISLENE